MWGSMQQLLGLRPGAVFQSCDFDQRSSAARRRLILAMQGADLPFKQFAVLGEIGWPCDLLWF